MKKLLLLAVLLSALPAWAQYNVVPVTSTATDNTKVATNNGTAYGLTLQGSTTLTGPLTAPNVYVTNNTFCLQTNLQPTSQATNITVNVASAQVFYYLATNNVYLVQPTGLPGGGTNLAFTIMIQQDGTGSRTLNVNTTYWKFPGGTVPALTTATNSVDVLSCIMNAQGTAVYCTSALNLK
jgi:hypothetical protein